MNKIIIADHHPITRIGIRDELHEANNRYRVIGEVSHGDALLSTLRREHPALLILELNMPGINGFQILRDIKNEFPDLKIVIFSSYPSEIYATHCINSGASGYIHKTTAPKEFSSIVKKIMEDKIFINKKRINDTNASWRKKVESHIKLSARETEVLNLLLEGHRNKDIARELEINEKTVSTYKSRLLKKLNLNNLAELINHSNALPV